jgi:hypothetical protein
LVISFDRVENLISTFIVINHDNDRKFQRFVTELTDCFLEARRDKEKLQVANSTSDVKYVFSLVMIVEERNCALKDFAFPGSEFWLEYE